MITIQFFRGRGGTATDEETVPPQTLCCPWRLVILEESPIATDKINSDRGLGPNRGFARSAARHRAE